jgi:hypothetical protein
VRGPSAQSGHGLDPRGVNVATWGEPTLTRAGVSRVGRGHDRVHGARSLARSPGLGDGPIGPIGPSP